jgi:LPS-assembly lipoprotein
MKQPLRLFLLLPAFLFLTACGFHPIYGSHEEEESSPVAAALNTVSIGNIPDRNGQMLRNDLIDRMYGKAGRPAKPDYDLSVQLSATEEDTGILQNATSTRSLLNLYGKYSLRDAHGKELLHGSAHSTTSFNKLDNEYGTLAAREDAYQRTTHEVSEQIVNRLSLWFGEKAEQAQ